MKRKGDITEESNRASNPIDLHMQIADLKQELAKTRRALRYEIAESNTDELTQILNRRGFKKVVAQEPEDVNGVALQFDLSGFKSINDQHGHDAGDTALKKFSSILQNFGMRTNDIVARMGGDEFTIILLNTSLDQATQRIEDLNQQTQNIKFSHDGKDLSFSARIGVGTFQNKTEIKIA